MSGGQGALDLQATWLKNYRFGSALIEQGRVVSVGDGIAWIKGLPSAGLDELLQFADGSRGMVFHLGRTLLGAILLSATPQLTAGTRVALTGRRASIATGDALLGRVVDPLGVVLDGGEPPDTHIYHPLDNLSPPIIERDFVQQPLYTGIRVIDSMIPIGHGQRQLIIGDEGLGRSSIALDAVINQRGKGVYCVYVLIGQKRSTVVNTLQLLREHGAIDYTTVVVGEAGALPGLKYLAPFAGCTIAEAWMRQGHKTLVVYDDLSTHARAYRELSLLLHRSPGREAYPGDIFYLHSRLLERATVLSPDHGGGSMTALPIVETRQGEISDYIPTNLISITDGQIYLDRTLFAGGFRPAIDVAKSVSRIGGKAQHIAIKQQSARIRLDYMQFLELEVFSRFGARLEASMEARLRRGRLLRELLKQERLAPHDANFQLAWLIAYNAGLFDPLPQQDLAEVMRQLTWHIAHGELNLESSEVEWLALLKPWIAGASPR